jgi:DNA-binding NarL/FixJ family response regulator
MIKIAVADDMPIILEGVRLLLNRVPDFNVVAEFSNGKELLDNSSDLDADIILTDIDTSSCQAS